MTKVFSFILLTALDAVSIICYNEVSQQQTKKVKTMTDLIYKLKDIEEYKEAQKRYLMGVQFPDGTAPLYLHQMEVYNKENSVSVANGWQLIASVPCKPCAAGIQAPSEIVLHRNHKGELVTHFHNLQAGGCSHGHYHQDAAEAMDSFAECVKLYN